MKSAGYKILVLLLVKLFSVTVTFFIVSNYIKFIDADFYLSGYFLQDKSIRIQMIQVLAWNLKNLVGPFFTHFLFSLISAAGIIYYYITGGKRWEVLLFLLLPSVFIWTSIVGKECISYGFFTLAIVIFAKYASGALRTYDFPFLIASIAVCMLLRPHYAIVLVWFLVAIPAIKKWDFKGSYKFLLVLSVTTMSLFIFNFWDEILFRGYSAIDPLSRYSRYEYFQVQPNIANSILALQPGFIRFKELLPLGLFVGILGPMPYEVLDRPVLAVFLLDGLFVLLSPVIIYCIANRFLIKNRDLFFNIFFLCLVPSYLYLIFIHAPFGLLNFGSAIRWRINFETAFYLFPLLLIFNFLDEKKV
jgi:hypothetical protein